MSELVISLLITLGVLSSGDEGTLAKGAEVIKHENSIMIIVPNGRIIVIDDIGSGRENKDN